jgi:hypothetical protein
VQNYFETIDRPLYSAEFHYFRIAREKWELMLARLGQLGVGAITITAPWGFHEFEQGTIDLTGTTNPRRDVTGLLDLCAALNFHCLLNPGPHAENCGVLNDGWPYWLPEISDKNDPTLVSSTTSWFRAVSKALVNRQWPNGPIVALQLEGEPAWGQQLVLSEELTEVRWPIWLRKRYKDIEALNTAYGTAYRSISDVPFPQGVSPEPTPPESDSQEFLAEIKSEKTKDFNRMLADTGWRLPLIGEVQPVETGLPSVQSYSLLDSTHDLDLTADRTLINLRDAIQIDPDPADIGVGPIWANSAPIRADGSVRRSFWQIRMSLWNQVLPDVSQEAELLSAAVGSAGLVTAAQDTSLALSLNKGEKPTVYQLRLNGTLLATNSIRARRGKLRGPYLIEDDAAQVDCIIYLNESTAPLTGFLLAYLQRLLIAQAETLSRCATLSAALGQMLSPAQTGPEAVQAETPPQTSYTLAEARRSLGEADEILRRAIASIGGLETGFDVMLGRSSSKIPEPAATPPAIRPEIFAGQTREILVSAGEVCQKNVPRLLSAAETVQDLVDRPDDLTVERYQHSHDEAATVASDVREALLESVAKLRAEMVSEQLPLVAWRVHNQIQEIAETLRWGVFRG